MNAQSNAPASLPDFVPVIIVGAGPTGITAATLLGQYGVECLVLDRHETVYPLCRGRCTPTTRCTASWPGWASARSSPPTADPEWVFG